MEQINNHFSRKSMGNMLLKVRVWIEIARVKIKGGGTNRIAIRKMFDKINKSSLSVMVSKI